MTARRGWSDGLGFALARLLAGILITAPALSAEPAGKGSDALIRAHVEAGEFAPAMALAQREAAAADRDGWLAQIAAAQARAGAREASMETAAGISDDRVRTGALGRVAGEPLGGRGGGGMADFDSLIDLITSTVAPDSWDDLGGPGSAEPFFSGVDVNPLGALGALVEASDGSGLAALRASSAPRARQESVRRSSPLRMVSLNRLEKQAQLRLARALPATAEMQLLAGLERVQYVFVYPDTGDLVVAGPAGDWRMDHEGRFVSTESGRPVVRLDDVVVVLRHVLGNASARFGCSITPRQEGLARLQAFVAESSRKAIQPHQRRAWLEQLRAAVGPQDVGVYGLDGRTSAARVLVEADYRMKLVGMGLEGGVPGVKSYLDLVRASGDEPPPMTVLRWWFTMNYDGLLTTADRMAFALQGQGVRVLSENEHLAAQGVRIHTGQSDALNSQFAQSFTAHFEALAERYPVYAELRNVFDLAMIATLIREEDLAGRVGWHATCFGPGGQYAVGVCPAPKTLDSVVNYRVVDRGVIIAGVSGGVAADPSRLVNRDAIRTAGDLVLASHHTSARREKLPADAWWWDH